MKTPCPHQGQCPFKDQPDQCPRQKPQTKPQAQPEPEARWREIVEETLAQLPPLSSW